MFTKNNRQLQSTAKAEINNDNQNNRKASVFINKLFARCRAFAFVAAVAFSFFAMSADSARAQQQNNYWASDGCYYWHNGSQWSRICPADQSRMKYYFDMVVNSQWQRIIYIDRILYSDNGNTFTTGYSYPTMTWTRTYSNGSVYHSSETRPEWTLVANNRKNGNLNNAQQQKNGNLNNAQQQNMLQINKMQSDLNQKLIDIALQPACRNSSYGCR